MDPFKLERDERQEVFQLIARLPRETRVRFLRWACARVRGSVPGGLPVFVEKTSGEARDVYGDWCLLIAAHGLPVRESWERLVEYNRTLR